MRFDEYMRKLNNTGGELIEIPGVNVQEFLCDYCTPQQAKANYDLALQWSFDYGDVNPKFVFVAYSMVLFDAFSMLTKIDPNDKKYDFLLNGLWAHYIGMVRKS